MTTGELTSCQMEDCFFPSTNCCAGFMDPSECPHYQGQAEHTPTDAPTENERFPWTGRPFGLKDLRVISAVRRPQLIGMVGLADAGKTTLLGMLFLMLYRGHRVAHHASFSGSYTMQGWENIARFLQLNSSGPIQFPPHTTQTGRIPGLLHLRFSVVGDHDRDFLLTDAPGEWFSNWTDNAGAENAAGARWIASNADKLIVFADTEALTGQQKGPARSRLEFLIRRVQHNVSKDAVALLWSKTDVVRPEELISAVNLHFHRCFPCAPIFSVKIPDKDEDVDETVLPSLTALFEWAFSPRPRRVRVHWPEPDHVDPFLSYRGSK